jgi:TonB family protein
MKTPNHIPTVLLAMAFIASPVCAKFESLKIEPTVIPQLSPVMIAEGITGGELTVALDVSAEGAVTDCLVLRYTHPALVGPFEEALKTWTFKPARQDGVPVPAQCNVTVNYHAEGAVISQPSFIAIDRHLQHLFGHRLAYKSRLARELDRVPPAITAIAPKYARDAEKQGVKGRVKVHFYIDERGSVRMPAIEGDAHPYLSQMAIEAVREWRFEPPTARGKPVLVAAVQEFNFSR